MYPDQARPGVTALLPPTNRAAINNSKHSHLAAALWNLCPVASHLSVPHCIPEECSHSLVPVTVICISLLFPVNYLLVISCGDPGTLPNGIQFGTDFTFNKTVSYQCNPGYLMEPPTSPTIRCTKDGTWNQSRPLCKGVCVCTTIC